MASNAENEIVTVGCSRRVAIFGTSFLYRWGVGGKGCGTAGGYGEPRAGETSERPEGRLQERVQPRVRGGDGLAARPGVIRGLERAPAAAFVDALMTCA